jgi:hypothetical protein
MTTITIPDVPDAEYALLINKNQTRLLTLGLVALKMQYENATLELNPGDLASIQILHETLAATAN